MEYTNDHILNLELAEEHLPNSWKTYNKYLEALDKSIRNQTTRVKRKIDEINLERKTLHESIQVELLQAKRKRDEAIQKSWLIETVISKTKIIV